MYAFFRNFRWHWMDIRQEKNWESLVMRVIEWIIVICFHFFYLVSHSPVAKLWNNVCSGKLKGVVWGYGECVFASWGSMFVCAVLVYSQSFFLERNIPDTYLVSSMLATVMGRFSLFQFLGIWTFGCFAWIIYLWLSIFSIQIYVGSW